MSKSIKNKIISGLKGLISGITALPTVVFFLPEISTSLTYMLTFMLAPLMYYIIFYSIKKEVVKTEVITETNNIYNDIDLNKTYYIFNSFKKIDTFNIKSYLYYKDKLYVFHKDIVIDKYAINSNDNDRRINSLVYINNGVEFEKLFHDKDEAIAYKDNLLIQDIENISNQIGKA